MALSASSPRSRFTAALASAVIIAVATVGVRAAVRITGAGATFPNPIYQKWFSEYNKLHPDVEINYQSLGSGAGVRQLPIRRCSSGRATVR
jgi:phosphate transport system substrate-binding protein